MGAGASVPTTEEEAIAAGYTKDQIDEWVAKNTTPDEAEKGARAIQAAAAKKKEREEAKKTVEDQKSLNAIGASIAALVPLDVQKLLNATAFPAMCSAIFKVTDEDESGTLDTSELVPAMATVLETMDMGGKAAITEEQAAQAMKDFDLDKNQTLDQMEFMELARVLILSTLIKAPPPDVYKYLVAAKASGDGKNGGLPSKPSAVAAAGAAGSLGIPTQPPPAPVPPHEAEEPAETAPVADATQAADAMAAGEKANMLMELLDGSEEQDKAAVMFQNLQRQKEARKQVEAKRAEKAAATAGTA